MAQLNLLPDVKLQYVRAQRRKQTVITISVLASAAFLAIFIALLLFVRVGQKQHMSAVDRDIAAAEAQLRETQDLDKILTIQNQLASLPALHDDKQISSRLFDYLNQLTPSEATISDVTLDFETGTLTLTGNADSLRTVNKFVDTLKFTKYTVSGETQEEGEAFSNVVLANFSLSESDPSSGRGETSYEIQANFEPAIFANSTPNTQGRSPVSLTVPKIISTRSATETPKELFVPQPEDEEIR